jgi:hypothetical protein
MTRTTTSLRENQAKQQSDTCILSSAFASIAKERRYGQA